MSRTALVTGGCGFIGSHLAKTLHERGWVVDIVDDLSSGSTEQLDDKRLSWSQCDAFSFKTLSHDVEAQKGEDVNFIQASFSSLAVCDLIRARRYDVIFHQAAIPRVSYSVENPMKTMHVNLENSCVLFLAAAEVNVPVVFASSSSVYGGATTLPTAESERGKMLPKSPYAMQKMHMEDYAALFGVLYGLRSVGLRYFNVFGPGQLAGTPYSTAIAAWCHAIKHGEVLRSDGDGEQTRDMCYIDNVIMANLLAAEKILGGSLNARCAPCYNVACGSRVSNNEILTYLHENFGERIKIRHAPERPGDVKHTLADISDAINFLGYNVHVEFWEGLKRTIEWWNL